MCWGIEPRRHKDTKAGVSGVAALCGAETDGLCFFRQKDFGRKNPLSLCEL